MTRHTLRPRLLGGLALAGLFLVAAGRAAEDEPGFTKLFNGKDLIGWKTYLDPKAKGADPRKTWTVERGVLVCRGKPNGYVYTDQGFTNYLLRFDWRYVRPEGLTSDADFKGNSGLLVHIQGEPKVWPRCVEVQGQ